MPHRFIFGYSVAKERGYDVLAEHSCLRGASSPSVMFVLLFEAAREVRLWGQRQRATATCGFSTHLTSPFPACFNPEVRVPSGPFSVFIGAPHFSTLQPSYSMAPKTIHELVRLVYPLGRRGQGGEGQGKPRWGGRRRKEWGQDCGTTHLRGCPQITLPARDG